MKLVLSISLIALLISCNGPQLATRDVSVAYKKGVEAGRLDIFHDLTSGRGRIVKSDNCQFYQYYVGGRGANWFNDNKLMYCKQVQVVK